MSYEALAGEMAMMLLRLEHYGHWEASQRRLWEDYCAVCGAWKPRHTALCLLGSLCDRIRMIRDREDAE